MIQQADTLSCDAARLAHWQNDPAYNYNRELQTPEWSLYDWLNEMMMRFLSKIFGSRFAQDYSELILILLFVIFVILLIIFIYKKRPELFMRSGKKTVTYSVHEDTIYGVDFETEIASALQRADFKEAIRLLYLQTLKYLSDKEIINWQLYKTPTQYLYEVKPEERRAIFRELTNRFLRVRYGNFEATRGLFDEMKMLQKQIEEGAWL